ncbi:MAG: tRNA 5-methoxyuridine(34)/uridine 5-oxyacetic acid(34) synthase CmoB [Fuerstiella sp.]
MRPPELFQFSSLFDQLAAAGYQDWADRLQHETALKLTPEQHGNLETWAETWHKLPTLSSDSVNLNSGRVSVSADTELSEPERQHFANQLRAFHPWRKGPFELFGVHIDTEWRSDWKWDRLQQNVELRGRRVLDVGCGNGYFGWRMLGAGASLVLGLDPFLLYVMQHEVVKRFVGAQLPNYVLPLSDDCISGALKAFDVTFSMGVLYHRTSPIDHLQTLHGSLCRGGQLVLETLVITDQSPAVLVPTGRYAKMRNVWFIPSLPMLQRWLERTGFHDVQVVDVTPTSVNEQRRTDWMTFESLTDFLDPSDPARTLEGYPAPVRAIVTARAR